MCSQGGCNQDALQREGRGLELGGRKEETPSTPRTRSHCRGESRLSQQDYSISWISIIRKTTAFMFVRFFKQSSNSAFSGLLEPGLRNKQGMLSLAKPLLTLTHITSFRFTSTELASLEQLLEKGGKNKQPVLCQCFLSKIF